MKDTTSYSIRRISHGNVSSFLIHSRQAAILVDCGSGGSEQQILEVLSGQGLEPGMLQLLILTHAHFDHAGSAKSLKSLTGCKIMVHQSEAARLRKGFTGLPGGTRWKARILVGVGRLIAPRIGRYQGVDPDLLSSENTALHGFGFPGRVIHTPGHTIGSQVVLMDGGELIAGDTVFGLPGKELFPPFAEDLPALLRSWELLSSLPIQTIFPAHGARISFDRFREVYQCAIQKYRA